ncbi:MAG TPA: hypothetical protein VFO29_02140 [Candidatus Rubrimentiphilum sp.]|nr:hypothetical protein [Candidatus Rubrimentiphilum sp.]
MSIHVLGYDPNLTAARAQFKNSWAFTQQFMARHPLYASKVRITGISLTRLVNPKTLQVSYRIERRIDIYGRDWNKLYAYHNSLGLTQPSTVLVEPDLPRFISTYGDFLIILTFALAAICAGPLRYVREGYFPIGMHPVTISLHLALAASAIVSLWYLAEQEHPSPALVLIPGLCAALLIGRWLVATRTQWTTVVMAGA